MKSIVKTKIILLAFVLSFSISVALTFMSRYFYSQGYNFFANVAQIVIVLVSFASGTAAIAMFRKRAKLSEDRSIDKSNFFATISHEIRTPLNSILGLTDVELSNAGLSEQTSKNLEQIKTSGNQLLKTINEIVDLSKIDTEKYAVSEQRYDSGSFINDVITWGFVKYSNKDVELKVKVRENIPCDLFGDVQCIRKIIDNMYSNAFKYTVKGSVSISFDFEIKPDKKEGSWIISVEDTGVGIKEDDLKKLTKYYSQIDANASRLGIGLTISAKLAKLMNGRLSVESVFGKGSEFTLRIPQRILDVKKLGAKTAANLMSFSNKGNTARDKYHQFRGKVLVVDDLQTNLDVAKGYMSVYGLQVDCVLSGRESVEKIKSQEVIYDCIFMDHMMPEMDGIEAFKKIRYEIGTEYAKNVPIIAFTANASIGNEEMFLKTGFNDFISKPIDSEVLHRVLCKYFQEMPSKQTSGKSTA